MNATELYEIDFAEWAIRNAELLRSGRVAEADLGHIAEEIEDMAKRNRRAVQNRLARLIQHLLKWQMQPAKRSPSWRKTVNEQRFRISQLLEENPSFQGSLEDWAGQVYAYAVSQAAIDTGLAEDSFPTSCPYTIQQILDRAFLPQ